MSTRGRRRALIGVLLALPPVAFLAQAALQAASGVGQDAASVWFNLGVVLALVVAAMRQPRVGGPLLAAFGAGLVAITLRSVPGSTPDRIGAIAGYFGPLVAAGIAFTVAGYTRDEAAGTAPSRWRRRSQGPPRAAPSSPMVRAGAPHLVGKGDDPLVPNLVAAINARHPGHVRAQGIEIAGPDGRPLTDFDIVTRNTVVQVKSGTGKGALKQALATQQLTDYPVIIYLPNARTSVVKGLEAAGFVVIRDRDALIAALAPP